MLIESYSQLGGERFPPSFNWRYIMQEEKFYGARYSTEHHDFGRILTVFEVGPDWRGYQYHGYCVPTAEEVAEWLRDLGERFPRA